MKKSLKKLIPLKLRQKIWKIKNKAKISYNIFSWNILTYTKRKKLGLLSLKNYNKVDYNHLDVQELLSIAKHEAHRIEKAFYAGYMNTDKRGAYHISNENLGEILKILSEKGMDDDRSDIQWLHEINQSFLKMDDYLEDGKGVVPKFNFEKILEYEELAKIRRSTRTWADSNFTNEELMSIGRSLIECARWSPCSGNRQPWFFKILINQEDKELLRGIKEQHCISAPLVIFVGVRQSSYGAIGSCEQGMYVDGGAAAMQMVMAAHQAGLGSCWNHFCYDFVYSRPKNLPIFRNFYKQMGISDDIEPIALVAFGVPAFVSPIPQRPPFEAMCEL